MTDAFEERLACLGCRGRRRMCFAVPIELFAARGRDSGDVLED